jgi:hypothetical protein
MTGLAFDRAAAFKAATALYDFYANDHSRWTQGAVARDAEGRELAGRPLTDAASWCIAGAAEVTGVSKEEWDAFAASAHELRGEPVVAWVDAPGRTFDEVAELLEEVAASTAPECICDFPTGCGGTEHVQCSGCGGDLCVCAACGGYGEMDCPGCDDCPRDDDDSSDEDQS